MKKFSPIQARDLSFEVNHVNLKKNQLFRKFGGNPRNAPVNSR